MNLAEMRIKANDDYANRVEAHKFENTLAYKEFISHNKDVANIMANVDRVLEEHKKSEYEAYIIAEEEKAREEARRRDIKRNGINSQNSPSMIEGLKKLAQGLS